MTDNHSLFSFAKAVMLLLLAIFLYDVMGAVIKHLSLRYPTQQLSMFRNFFGLVPTVLILLWSQDWEKAGKPIVIRQWKLGLVRGGLGAMTQISFYLALVHLELATATTIVFAGPLIITALSVPLLGLTVGPWRWFAVLVGFAGVVLVIRPTADSFTWYAILPLCSAFGYASISVTARLFDKTVPTAMINLYYNVGSLAAATALVFFVGGFVQIQTWEDWMWLAAMGIAGGTAAFFMISAYRLAEPSSLSPFEYFGIPFSFCLGWIFFSEAPFDRLIPGALLIVGGGLLIIWRERNQAKQRINATETGF